MDRSLLSQYVYLTALRQQITNASDRVLLDDTMTRIMKTMKNECDSIHNYVLTANTSLRLKRIKCRGRNIEKQSLTISSLTLMDKLFVNTVIRKTILESNTIEDQNNNYAIIHAMINTVLT